MAFNALCATGSMTPGLGSTWTTSEQPSGAVRKRLVAQSVQSPFVRRLRRPAIRGPVAARRSRRRSPSSRYPRAVRTVMSLDRCPDRRPARQWPARRRPVVPGRGKCQLPTESRVFFPASKSCTRRASSPRSKRTAKLREHFPKLVERLQDLVAIRQQDLPPQLRIAGRNTRRVPPAAGGQRQFRRRMSRPPAPPQRRACA